MNRSKLFFIGMLVLLLVGLPAAAIAAPPVQQEGQDYIVQAGESLADIAEEIYGDPLAYLAIVEATNARAIDDDTYTVIIEAEEVEAGQKLYLPSAEEASVLVRKQLTEEPPVEPSTVELVLAAPRDLAPGPTDPYYTHPTLHVWESLIATDAAWVPRPQLARAWEQSEDGLSWTFYLREDVVFSDGAPFDADVVIANVERNRLISPARSPFYTFQADSAYGDLDRVEKVDDYTVRFVHNTVEPALPARMANFYSAMFAPNSFDEAGNFKDFPIGSGPFRLVEHVPDQYLVLEANPNYYGPPPASQTIRVRTIPDPNTRASALRAGEIHGVLDLGAIQPITAKELVATGDFAESAKPIPITHYIFLNGTKEPWNDVRMRQAVSMIVDRQLIVEKIFLGYGIPAGSMLNTVVKEWHDASIELPYDPEQARALADEVLAGERVSALLLIPSYQIERYPYKALGEYVQAQLAQLGVDAEIQILDGATFNETTAAGEYDLALRIQGLANSEPIFLFERYLGCEGDQNQSMSLGYCNEEVDGLLEAVRTASRPLVRAALYNELQTIAAHDLPVIPLFYDKSVIVFDSEVTGYDLETTYWVTLDQAAIR